MFLVSYKWWWASILEYLVQISRSEGYQHCSDLQESDSHRTAFLMASQPLMMSPSTLRNSTTVMVTRLYRWVTIIVTTSR